MIDVEKSNHTCISLYDLLFVLYLTGHPGMGPMGPRMGHPGSRMPGPMNPVSTVL